MIKRFNTRASSGFQGESGECGPAGLKGEKVGFELFFIHFNEVSPVVLLDLHIKLF